VIVVDSSVLVAVFKGEADEPSARRVLEAEPELAISAANALETCIVLRRARPAFEGRDLFAFLAAHAVTIVPVDADIAGAAMEADRRYGRGRHPARLNFGDCFAYALAKTHAAPLFFIGDDFASTDVDIYDWARA
jgi:ribonuclease VapC